ncbi:diguanylate cyclase (GGDEF)-like protein [Sanguibacter antarcticus]|uniref:Diguanylate cyclase (GGDEF)-like protein n=1 Tax=Sanguibacter antarcticus TaxID=372484 RepID=A0A2A9E391_9MICO|nr:diguanylate cyclase (GGDEF)-like protein [Sanguibacter antarcticus]
MRKVDAGTGDTGPAGSVRALDADDVSQALDLLEESRSNDGSESLDRAVDLEKAARALGNVELTLRARLVQADAIERQGHLAEATQIMWQVHDYAADHDRPRLLAGSHLGLSWAFRDIGDRASYLEHSVKAVDALDEGVPLTMRARYLMRLADALGESGSAEESRARYEQADRLAEEAGDVALRLRSLNNRAYGEYAAGDLDQAQETVGRLLEVSEQHAIPLLPQVWDTIGRLQLALGDHAAAVASARRALAENSHPATREITADAEFNLTLAAALRGLGDHDGAQEALDRCRETSELHGLRTWRALAEEEQSAIHAGRGDFESAFRSYKEFYALEKEMVSHEREAQARLQQAMFETSEARQEAARFQHESLRDPLTQLFNRRHVDQTLPGLIVDGRSRGLYVAAALIDLDHFKRVNDTFSHAVGDEVLVQVGALIDELADSIVLPASAFAARLGGEEFLLVVQAADRSGVVTLVEGLRRAVADHDWSRLTGNLPVTVSIGIATSRDDDTQSTLLSRADSLMYAAKHAGRNRSSVDQPG